MNQHLPKNQTKRDLIIEVWEALDCESVGAHELEQIQKVVGERLNEGAVDSPASIARILADEGAVLRHPEVLDWDTRWRERNLSELIAADDLNFSGLSEAAESIRKLDALRRHLDQENDVQKLARLRELASRIKEEQLLLAQSRVVAERERLEAGEMVQWLTVWLQTPDLFDNWLNLRMSSPEFVNLLEK